MPREVIESILQEDSCGGDSSSPRWDREADPRARDPAVQGRAGQSAKVGHHPCPTSTDYSSLSLPCPPLWPQPLLPRNTLHSTTGRALVRPKRYRDPPRHRKYLSPRPTGPNPSLSTAVSRALRWSCGHKGAPLPRRRSASSPWLAGPDRRLAPNSGTLGTTDLPGPHPVSRLPWPSSHTSGDGAPSTSRGLPRAGQEGPCGSPEV